MNKPKKEKKRVVAAIIAAVLALVMILSTLGPLLMSFTR